MPMDGTTATTVVGRIVSRRHAAAFRGARCYVNSTICRTERLRLSLQSVRVARAVTDLGTKVSLAQMNGLPESDKDFAGNMALKLLVIDDHPLVLEGVAAALE